MKTHFALIFSIILTLACAKKSYQGYQLLRVQVHDEGQANFLSKYSNQLDFWSHIVVGGETDILGIVIFLIF